MRLVRCDFNRQELSNELSNSRNGRSGGIAPGFGNQTYGTYRFADRTGGVPACPYLSFGRLCLNVCLSVDMKAVTLATTQHPVQNDDSAARQQDIRANHQYSSTAAEISFRKIHMRTLNKSVGHRAKQYIGHRAYESGSRPIVLQDVCFRRPRRVLLCLHAVVAVGISDCDECTPAGRERSNCFRRCPQQKDIPFSLSFSGGAKNAAELAIFVSQLAIFAVT